MRLGALDGSIDIRAFRVKFGLVVGGKEGSIGEEFVPVLLVQSLAEYVVHALAEVGQLARGVDAPDECGIVVCVRIERVAMAVSENLLYVDQLGIFTEDWF